MCCLPVAAAVIVDEDLTWDSGEFVGSYSSTRSLALTGEHYSPAQDITSVYSYSVMDYGYISQNGYSVNPNVSGYDIGPQTHVISGAWTDYYTVPAWYTGASSGLVARISHSVGYDYGRGVEHGDTSTEYVSYMIPVNPITQHVTVNQDWLGLQYEVILERNGVYSDARLVGGITDRTQSGSGDYTFWVDSFFGPYTLEVTIDGEMQSVSWGGSVTPTPTPTPTIPPDINNTTAVDLDKPINFGYTGPDWDNLRLPGHLPGLDAIKSLKDNARNSSTSLFPLYNDSYQSFCDTIDGYCDFMIELVSGVFKIVLTPIYSLADILVQFLTWITRLLAGFSPYLYVPGMFLGAIFRIIPPFIINIAALLILLDAFLMFLRWAIPELNRQVNE
ncbi:hypothetical protein McpCs1_14690 [Methanocorpusculaceae archaeon Cs1]|uniref:Uncharacterized protein n=2 Tax=Methanorbis rubei TaxID=3028300 RepID=A0AAE4MH92_9EURY|nr:hypothetical protein [Methanocorpusculaceae archaeon Cs1]